MRKVWNFLIVSALPACALFACVPSATVLLKSPKTQVFVHYMPWFNDPSHSGNGKYGHKWKMANCDPALNELICSHYQPVTGAYDSQDPNILEYQTLLLKMSGVNGVAIYWYGLNSPSMSKATDNFVPFLERAGLKFTIAYDELGTKHWHQPNGDVYGWEGPGKPLEERIAQSKRDMTYLKTKLFKSSSYLYFQNRPMVLDFGGDQTYDPYWLELISTAGHPWMARSEQRRTRDAGFSWIHWQRAGFDMERYFRIFREQARNEHWSFVWGSAYPGYWDYYKEGGWMDSLNYIPSNGTQTLENSLRAWSNADFIQVATWNDWIEGTTIEPSKEYGTKYLEVLQQFTASSYTAKDLELPIRLFRLRQHKSLTSEEKLKLDQVFDLIVVGNIPKATTILVELER